MFSRACEYAIKMMIYISLQEEEDHHIGVKEIAQAIDSPEAFTAKILQQLVKNKLLKSFKGPTGGFSLVVDKEVKLVDIVLAIDGSKVLEECVLGLPGCSSKNPCPLHEKYSRIRNQLKETVLSTNIRDNDFLASARNLK